METTVAVSAPKFQPDDSPGIDSKHRRPERRVLDWNRAQKPLGTKGRVDHVNVETINFGAAAHGHC